MRSWNWLRLTPKSPQGGCGQSSRLILSCPRSPFRSSTLMDIYYLEQEKPLIVGNKLMVPGEMLVLGEMLALKIFWMMVQPMVFWTNMAMLSRFWGDEPDDVPALHAMRAGQKKCFSTTSSTGLGFNNQVSRATMPTCSWEEAEAVHEEELQEHWALKTLWMNELRHVAIGGDESREQGQWLMKGIV